MRRVRSRTGSRQIGYGPSVPILGLELVSYAEGVHVLLLATFLTVHFGDWRESWHGTSGLAHVGESAFHSVRWENQGVLAALEPDTGDCLWTLVLDTPAGFALAPDCIYVNSMYGNRVSILSPTLDFADVLARWFMNDLHSLTLTDRGLLVTSSGVDGVVEVSWSGDEFWAWFATERAYPIDQGGSRRKLSRRRDYRQDAISTHQQATHCNSAVAHWHKGKDLVLATLFHQGELIAIDRETRKHTVLLTGMQRPHSLRKTETGWMVSDSGSNGVVLLDEDFWIASIVMGEFDWVQDATIYRDRLLVADANHSRLVWWDIARNRQEAEIRYSDQWKIYQVEAVEGVWEERLRDLPILSHSVSTRLSFGGTAISEQFTGRTGTGAA